jgi:hypothetical protein
VNDRLGLAPVRVARGGSGRTLQRLGWDPLVVQYMFQKVLFDEMETYLADRYGQDPLIQSPARRAEAVQRVSIVRPLFC